MALIEFRPEGLYCAQADVFIDPWRKVPKALITHAHSDHSRWGMGSYLAHRLSVPLMQHRLGKEIAVQGVEYGEKLRINGVEISFHPAGHVVGSAQIRLSYGPETWVITGDYKTEDDGLTTAYEPVKCTHFLSECTFGLPVYRWQRQAEIAREINEWWASNAAIGRASLISAYSLGKAQRVLHMLDPSIGPIFTHGAVEQMNQAIRDAGVPLPPTTQVIAQGPEAHKKSAFRQAIIIAPPGAIDSAWAKRFQPLSLGIASGWMALRGARRRRAADRGFVLSDHADWDGLNQAVEASGAEHIYVTHGYTDIYSRWLKEQGYDAHVVRTEFGEEETTEP
ncbi:MAG: ligase-associated DNA damage response exonuclease [Bacteroidota bacterium]